MGVEAGVGGCGRGTEKQLDSAPPGSGRAEAGRKRGRRTRAGEKKGKFKPPSKTYRKNEEAELLPIVQYSPSLHNNVE